MSRFVLIAAATLPLFSCASARGEPPPSDTANVLYSLTVGQNDVLELSVYNPLDYSVCTSYLNWPGTGNVLRVTGRDGKEWKYIGLEVSVVGRPQDLKIAPHSEATTRVDLRKNYQSTNSETRIGKVYYGTRFHSC